MERELLKTIVETLYFKEFRNIILDQRIKVYTNHNNSTYKNFTTELIMWWHLILEEYDPEMCYIKVKNNVVTDALGQLNLEEHCSPSAIKEKQPLFDHMLTECYGQDKADLPTDFMSLNYKAFLEHHHNQDKELLPQVKLFCKNYTFKAWATTQRYGQTEYC